MAEYRKKPVVIEAWQFTNFNDFDENAPDWLKEAEIVYGRPTNGDVCKAEGINGEDVINICTLEGTMQAYPNDWIIRGINGEFYPCKPHIFAATYEPADTEPSPPTATLRQALEKAKPIVERELKSVLKLKHETDNAKGYAYFYDDDIAECREALTAINTALGEG